MSFGAVDPHDEETVAAMVGECRPDWTVTDSEPIARGTDALYLLDAERDDRATAHREFVDGVLARLDDLPG